MTDVVAPAARAEREIVLTGIGGQGIQLVAKILAEAAVRDGRHAMLFGIYAGMMRGGPSESTVVIGGEEIQAPPIVPHCWSLIAMHRQGFEPALGKLRAGGLLFLNQTLVSEDDLGELPKTRIDGVPATRIAEQAGNIAGASMVALGAFVVSTGIVSFDNLALAMQAALPSHRRSRAEENLRLLELGADAMRGRA